ncbi:xylulokinase [Raineyella sp.]|uniref:xylulokinase n=1 Tax=Raineyella sp. TaxID=1911550 RepID=UPI002B200121|nr:FGGY family carbohydrate kinase [Raineyella sp.]MEA5154304.1 FGGY family carbohydrate kinase [Raineyella sp.]
MTRKLVAGVDSSTQSCKVMIRDADTGALVRSGAARHATGTEVDPEVWLRAFREAIRQAGGLEDVKAISVGGQQHGMVTLDEDGTVVRNAILWNDTRSGRAAADLVREFGDGDEDRGRQVWADRTGVVPVASITVTKLRWLAEHEPENLARTAAVALPHDWLSWKLMNEAGLEALATDRSDASGTGYFDPVENIYCPDIIAAATGSDRPLQLPKVLGPCERMATVVIDGREMILGPGCGDNAGAAFGLDLRPGQVAMSLGTSGVVSLVSELPTHDPSGIVTGFADATGRFLPLVCTLNASRVLDVYADLLDVDHAHFSSLALSAPPGAEGLVCIPYLEGERTPNLPNATGALHGIRLSNLTPANIARAAVEGMLCGVGEGIRALRAIGVPVSEIHLIGGGAQGEAVRHIAPSVVDLPVIVPERGEYVADGAARQAAWALAGTPQPPEWTPRLASRFVGDHDPSIQARYAELSHLVAMRHS